MPAILLGELDFVKVVSSVQLECLRCLFLKESGDLVHAFVSVEGVVLLQCREYAMYVVQSLVVEAQVYIIRDRGLFLYFDQVHRACSNHEHGPGADRACSFVVVRVMFNIMGNLSEFEREVLCMKSVGDYPIVKYTGKMCGRHLLVCRVTWAVKVQV